jgi:polysaccharide deacetylase family protein (PEP-CTERM system associated)
VTNALTFDLEDWFQVSNLEHLIPYAQWGECQSRLVANTCRLLELLARAGVRATFFVLGWNAERFPGLVQEVAAAGHEIASHGYAHRLVYEQTPEAFAADLARATEVIGSACGVRPNAYRAPSFSITPRAAWAFDVLAANGFEVDASVFPIFHERYGYRGAPRLPHRVLTDRGARLIEAPPSTLRLLGRNYPFAGGAYFRILPYPVVQRFCRRLHAAGEPTVFYFHPWELDPDLPRFRLSPFRRLRSYVNLDRTEARLRELLHDFRFSTLSQLLAERPRLPEWQPQAPRRQLPEPVPGALQPAQVGRKEPR